MLEKNKDYLEMRVSSTDCAFTQNASTQISVDGFVYTTYFNLPDPGELYVVISKEKFEKLQTENEELKKKLHEFDPMPEFKELLKNLYSTEDVEKLEWTLNHICGGRGSVNGWRAVSSFWQHHYETLSNLVGYSSVEEIQDYLTNEAECDTLREAISKLKDQVKYTCDEWYSANSRNNSWKAAAECNSPKELIKKLNLLRDDISGRSTVIESYKHDIEKWQKATGCLRPEDISTESMVSKSVANEIVTANEDLWSENEKCEKRIEALLSEIREWRKATGCISPKDISTSSLIVKATSLEQEVTILNGALQEWKDGTGCPSPSAAKTLIESGASWCHAYNEAKDKNRKLIKEVNSWEHVTGYSNPEDYMHARISNAWQDFTGCTSPQEAGLKINNLCGEIWELKDRCGFHKEKEWKESTGCDSPEDAKNRIKGLENAIRLTNSNMLKELENNIDEWQKATGCDTPGRAEEKLEHYKSRLGNAVQAASIAAKHLDNITF